MRRTKWALAAGAGVLGVAILAGCGSQPAAGPQGSNAVQVQALAPRVVTEHLTIVTGKMIHKPGWPQFQPSTFTVPKGATVRLVITSYDDGTAPLPANSPFLKVQGLVTPDETVNGQPVSAVAPDQVAHTFTIPALGVNVPIPAAPTGKTVTVTAEFVAQKAGTFTWQCEAPCGTGASGWGGPMITPGYMTGTVTVQ
ncbi:MAG: hypothetical protein K6U14_01475 [Firmicutes bacterium]|nr:hypothetical protein [Alicyclobacillaceae bacterium]MCL6496290.1 hypothetical protein [Bacillota bacterium]